MEAGKKIFFASDIHLGLDIIENPLDSERRFVRWLDSIKHEAHALYLLGDIFDYWFEFRYVVPKGYVRLLGKLAEFVDSGIEVVIFPGNHDVWMFDYFQKEIGATVVRDTFETEICGKKFFMAHGDGLGDPSKMFKFLRCFFRNGVCQWLYKLIHPDLTTPLGYAWSRRNRRIRYSNSKNGGSCADGEAVEYLGEDREYMVQFAKESEASSHFDFYVFGHRHIMLDLMISKESRVVILGEWIQFFSYAVFDGENLWLDQYVEE